jgi:hypothetical protein
MTLTAIQPEVGLSNGRDVSLFNVAQASALISALRVVLRALYGSFTPRGIGVAAACLLAKGSPAFGMKNFFWAARRLSYAGSNPWRTRACRGYRI